MSARVRRTLGDLIRHGMPARAECRTCNEHRVIDLEALAAKVGPDYSLWNRRCRCRLTPGCPGWIKFFIGTGWPRLAADVSVEYRWIDSEWSERMERKEAERQAVKKR